jgi:hypothetical protein
MGLDRRTSAAERPGVVADRTRGAGVARQAVRPEAARQAGAEGAQPAVARPEGPAVVRVGRQAVVRVARLEGQRVAQQEEGAEVLEEQQEAGAVVAPQAGLPRPDLALRPEWAVFDRSSRNPARFCRSPRVLVKQPAAALSAILTRQGRILATFNGMARKTRLPLPGGEATVKQLSAPQDARDSGVLSP